MSEYYHLIMADLKKFRVDTNEKIDQQYIEKGYQVVTPNMYMFEKLDKGPRYLSRQTNFDKDRYFDYSQQEKIPYFEDVPQFEFKPFKATPNQKVVDFDDYLKEKMTTSEEDPKRKSVTLNNFTTSSAKKDKRLMKKTVYDLANKSDWRDVSAD